MSSLSSAIRLGFEQPQYEVEEESRFVNDLIYITKNGMVSEQILRFLVKNPQGSAVIGMWHMYISCVYLQYIILIYWL